MKITSLEEAAVARVEAVAELESAAAELERVKGPYHAAYSRHARAREAVERIDDGMAAVKRAHAITVALREQAIRYEGPLALSWTAGSSSSGRLPTVYFLVAVGADGTGLYLHTPKRSHRYEGKEYAIREEVALSHGVEPSIYGRHLAEAGIREWQNRTTSAGSFAAARRPLPPPEGGKWRWLKVREQEELPARAESD